MAYALCMDIRARVNGYTPAAHTAFVCLDGSCLCFSCASGETVPDVVGAFVIIDSRTVTLDDNPYNCDNCHARIAPEGTI